MHDSRDDSPFGCTIELYSQPDRRIFIAHTVAAFADHLKHLPTGTTLYQYVSGHGEPPADHPALQEQLEHTCASLGLRLEPSEFSICLCPETH